MGETYYIIPKIGTGSWDNPIRPAYEAEIKQALGIRSGVRLQRKMDDPFDYKAGFGLYAFIDAPVGAEDVLEAHPGVVRLGADPNTALTVLRSRALTNVREDAWVRSKTDAQVIKTLTVRRQSLGLTHGTDTTDFTDSDGTTWDSLSTNALTKTHFSGTDGNTTFDVSSNQGAATGVVGGAFYQSEDVWIQDGVPAAEDMVCTLTHVSGPVNSSNDWIKFIGRYNSSGHFFYMENQDQGGDDTRLFEYISGTGASQLDTSTFTAAATSRTFQMTIATNGATDADIDCQVNGTDRINFSGTINAGLRSTSGHTGIYSLSSRNSAHVVDTLAMTNNDAGVTYIDLAGDEPAASGALTQLYEIALAGSQSAPSGALSAQQTLAISLTSGQPAPSGSLSRLQTLLRSLAGNQSNPTGDLSLIQYLIALAGNQPNATGTIAAQSIVAIDVSGAQPAGSGALTLIQYGIVLSGNQPNPTGSLTALQTLARSLAGNQPAGSGALSALQTLAISLAGDQPAASGALAILYALALAGNQPNGTGSISAETVTIIYALIKEVVALGELRAIEAVGDLREIVRLG